MQNSMSIYYYVELAICRIKGDIIRKGYKVDKSIAEMLKKNVCDLDDNEINSIFSFAKEKGIDLFYFKRTGGLLPRINKVMGFLRNIEFESLLDVGSGRGAFLIPFMEAFPYVKVYSTDILEERYIMLKDMENGGLDSLKVWKKDICNIEFFEKSVDIVTLLEVLEHIPNVEKAIENATKIAKKYVILSVPSKEDDNEEHINLLTKEKLTSLFENQGVKKISFDEVHNHLLAIVTI